MEYLLDQFYSALLAVSPHSLLTTSRFLPGRGQSEKQQRHCAGTAQKEPEHWCVINNTVATDEPEYRRDCYGEN